jgi:predicted metalloprotease
MKFFRSSILAFLKPSFLLTSLMVVMGGTSLVPSAQAAWNEPTLSFVSQGLNTFWGTMFQRMGLLFVPPIIVPHPGIQATACGPSTLAHYCANNNTIHLNMRALTRLAYEVGDSAAFFAISHEYGHSVQAQLGLLRSKVPTVALELQADCLAGIFFAASNRVGVLEKGDLEEGMMTALMTGDYNYWHANHHGTPQQRKKAFLMGFRSPKSCFQIVSPKSRG